MNKIKLILICFSLILVGCDEDSVPTVSTAPEDCNGIVGGVSVVDCAGVCGGTATAADCTACSSDTYDCDGTCDGSVAIDCAGVCGGTATEGDCILSSLAGTYTPSSATIYDNEECSGEGITNICTTDDSVTNEADCPTGVCFDGVSTDEDSCPDGDWYTAVCDTADDDEEMYLTETACEEAGYDWIPMGWISFLSLLSGGELPSITIVANGTYTDPGGVEGTLVVLDDGTTITTSIPARCEESMYLTQSECEGAGLYWSDAEEQTLGYDISTGVMTMNMTWSGGCECNDGTSDCEAAEATENTSDCSAVGGEWEEGECMSIVWAK